MTLLASSSQSCRPRVYKFYSKLQWSLNFVRWGIIFVDHQYRTCCMSPFGAWNFEVAPRYMENMCTFYVDRTSNGGLNSYNKTNEMH